MSNFKLTKEDLEKQIKDVQYVSFAETGTLCTIVLTNGYTVTGTSNCINPDNFKEEIGKEVAYQNAFDQLWNVLGYNEKQRWYEETQLSAKERVELELKDLDEKTTKLAIFLDQPRPDDIDEYQWDLCHEQLGLMRKYATVLASRLAKW